MFSSVLKTFRASLSFFLLFPLGWLRLQGGLTSPLLFSALRSTPYVRFRNGLAFPLLGMTAGWAGVAGPARAHALVAATRAAVKVCGAATGTRAGRESRLCGNPSPPVPGRSETAVSAPGPTFPGLSCIFFLWGLRSVW